MEPKKVVREMGLVLVAVIAKWRFFAALRMTVGGLVLVLRSAIRVGGEIPACAGMTGVGEWLVRGSFSSRALD